MVCQNIDLSLPSLIQKDCFWNKAIIGLPWALVSLLGLYPNSQHLFSWGFQVVVDFFFFLKTMKQFCLCVGVLQLRVSFSWMRHVCLFCCPNTDWRELEKHSQACPLGGYLVMIPTYTVESLSDAMHLFTGSLNFGSVNAANLFCLPALHRWKWFCIPAERAAANPSPCLPRQQQLRWPSLSSVLASPGHLCHWGGPAARAMGTVPDLVFSAYCFMATQQEVQFVCSCLIPARYTSFPLFS